MSPLYRLSSNVLSVAAIDVQNHGVAPLYHGEAPVRWVGLGCPGGAGHFDVQFTGMPLHLALGVQNNEISGVHMEGGAWAVPCGRVAALQPYRSSTPSLSPGTRLIPAKPFQADQGSLLCVP